MKEKKKYPIPDEIALFINKAKGAEKLRDIAIKIPFGYKKALRAAGDAEHFSWKFWNSVHNLYPELSRKKLLYDYTSQSIFAED
uniref:Uncharacterized protein n=1 Tax=viral metagenome TaxID=1070528 RepID=A0A6H1ZW89_9ZZZZ